MLRKILKISNILIATLVFFLVFHVVRYLTDNTGWAYGFACIVAFIPAYLIDSMDREKVKTFKKVVKLKDYLKRIKKRKT